MLVEMLGFVMEFVVLGCKNFRFECKVVWKFVDWLMMYDIEEYL